MEGCLVIKRDLGALYLSGIPVTGTVYTPSFITTREPTIHAKLTVYGKAKFDKIF